MKYSAIDIAKYIIHKCCIDNKPISNLKLNCILYILQRYWLTEFNEPLFDNDFVVHSFGPCILDVYHKFCMYGAQPIWLDYGSQQEIAINPDYKNIIDKIVNEKRTLEFWDLLDEVDNVNKMLYDNGKGVFSIIPKEMIKN